MLRSATRLARLFALALIELLLAPTPWRLAIRWTGGTTGTRRFPASPPPAPRAESAAVGESASGELAEDDGALEDMERGSSCGSASVVSVQVSVDLVDAATPIRAGEPRAGAAHVSPEAGAAHDPDLQTWLLHEASGYGNA